MIVKKFRQDLRNKTIREPAVKLLVETFGDLICDPKFVACLASKLEFIIYLLSNKYKNVFIRFGQKLVLIALIKKSPRDAIYMNKMKSLQKHKHTLDIKDENISDFIKVKKNETAKTYAKAQYLIHTEKSRKLHESFPGSNEGFQYSFTTLF